MLRLKTNISGKIALKGESGDINGIDFNIAQARK